MSTFFSSLIILCILLTYKEQHVKHHHTKNTLYILKTCGSSIFCFSTPDLSIKLTNVHARKSCLTMFNNGNQFRPVQIIRGDEDTKG